MRRRVVISGMGAVTPFGAGIDRYWEGLSTGTSAAQLISTFDATELPTSFAAEVPLAESDLDEMVEDGKIVKTLSRSGKFAMIAGQEAGHEARLGEGAVDPYRLGTSLGAGGLGAWDLEHGLEVASITVKSLGSYLGNELPYPRMWKAILDDVHPLSPLKALSNIPTAHLAIRFNARGVCQTITTACTSSAQAIGEAFRQIRWGLADVIIAGGSDSMINPNGLVAFSMLGVMSRNNREWRRAARPFDKRRDGFMLGEGAAVFVLEELGHCLARGCQPIAELSGYGNTCDAFRLTDEPPEAWGSIAAMRTAIEDAGMGPHDVDYINAHGTGTVMNDRTETHAIRSVLGDRAVEVPISSTKSMIGHLVAAAGAVELAACVLALRHQKVPPTINYEEPDPSCDLDYVPNTARDARVNVALSNSFGFGGQNACLLLRRYEPEPRGRSAS